MLKGISPIISPELLKLIAEMGHGDELVLADANFPGASIGKRCIRCDGHGCADVMRALLTLFPLDDFGDRAAGGHGGSAGHVPRGQGSDLEGVPRGGGYRPADRAIRYDGS